MKKVREKDPAQASSKNLLTQTATIGSIEVYNSLQKGGFFAFWENNPWNLGTRYVMSRIPFDRDAILVNCLKAQKMLASAGFTVMSTNFLFIFPGFLRRLRFLEPSLSWLPFGGQYQVLCRKD